MNSKIKILLVGLAAVCAIALMIAFQLNGVNKSLRSQFALKEQEFQSEKQGLSQQFSSTLEAKKRFDAEMGDLRVKFDSVAKEKDSLKDKFDLVTKERASLVEKVQDLAKQKKKLEDEVVQLKKTGGSEFSPSPIISTSTPTDDAYWATVLRDKASLEIQVKNLTTQLTDLQLKTEKAMEEGRKLDLQLKTVIGARIDLERRIVYNEKLAETLSEDLVREKRDKKAVVDQLDGLRQENYELKSRLMALGDKKISLETKVVDLQSEREVLAKRLAELDQILQERVDQIIQVKNDLKSARNEAKNISAKDSRVVQLQPIVVKASEEGPAGNRKAPTAGQVLAINEENNFVIIDLGEQDGSRVGQVFSIYRNTQKIASIEIIQTRKEISAADIKNVSSGAKIKIGDTVS
jgi:chromosome segregation ATPase